MHREYATIRGGSDCLELLAQEKLKEDKGYDEEGDNTARVLGILDATERDRYND